VVLADRWDIRALNTTLSLAYVATGRIAADVLLGTSPVHAAAGSLLAAEAGATVTDVVGRPWSLESDGIVVCANPELLEEVLELAAALP
jgi:myo-inositol-1(or 4)-monophosphatase